MKIAVDANIVFSAILNTESKIGQLLMLGSDAFQYHSIFQLKEEIQRHKAKILSISGYSEERYAVIYEQIISRISFIDHNLISENALTRATELVQGVDEDDAPFIALAIHLKVKIWSGDKKLQTGLEAKGVKLVIGTEELYELFLERKRYLK